MAESAGLRTYAFVLAVPDLRRAVGYFEKALGFGRDWGDGTHWQALSRGGVRMMIGHCPDAMLPAQTGDHSYFAYLHVDDVDALHAEFVRRGAIIQQPPVDRPWGMREMAVATPDGHRMMIGQKISRRPGSVALGDGDGPRDHRQSAGPDGAHARDPSVVSS